jgi:hypothetical protein
MHSSLRSRIRIIHRQETLWPYKYLTLYDICIYITNWSHWIIRIRCYRILYILVVRKTIQNTKIPSCFARAPPYINPSSLETKATEFVCCFVIYFKRQKFYSLLLYRVVPLLSSISPCTGWKYTSLLPSCCLGNFAITFYCWYAKRVAALVTGRRG